MIQPYLLWCLWQGVSLRMYGLDIASDKHTQWNFSTCCESPFHHGITIPCIVGSFVCSNVSQIFASYCIVRIFQQGELLTNLVVQYCNKFFYQLIVAKSNQNTSLSGFRYLQTGIATVTLLSRSRPISIRPIPTVRLMVLWHLLPCTRLYQGEDLVMFAAIFPIYQGKVWWDLPACSRLHLTISACHLQTFL